MQLYTQTENIHLIGVEVKTFPTGITEAFTGLSEIFGTERDYFGVSWMDEHDEIKYYAMTRATSADEEKLHGYETLIIESGEYKTETITDWMSKTDTIKDVFNKLTAGNKPDKNNPCIEWYRSKDEMLCMVKC